MIAKIKLILYGVISMCIIQSCTMYQSIQNNSAHVLALSNFNVALADTTIFKSCVMVPLETNEKSLIQSIERICVDGDKLFIFDDSQEKVTIFNKEGGYIGNIYDIGEGPKEYIQISDICVDPINKNIIILCDRPYKVMYYTYSGKFVKEMYITDYYSELAIDKKFIYGYSMKPNKPTEISIFNHQMELKETYELPSGKQFSGNTESTIYSFGNGNNMTRGRAIYFSGQFDNSIYEVDEGTIYKKYELDFKNHQLPSSLLEEKLSSWDFLQRCEKNKYVCSIMDFSESENYLLFKTNIGLFVYDKKKDALNGYRFILNSDLRTGGSEVMSISVPNRLVEILQVDKFKEQVGRLKKRGVNIDSNILKQYESINDDDNPILLIYEFE